jgi:alkyl hydroperoxide reductase subunit D
LFGCWHEKILREKGMSEEAVLAPVRLASVIHGIATVLDPEKMAATQPVTA